MLALSSDDSQEVVLRTFEDSPAGMIQSFVSRFPAKDDELLALHLADKAAGVA